jgi:large subunit ribosomal protein L13
LDPPFPGAKAAVRRRFGRLTNWRGSITTLSAATTALLPSTNERSLGFFRWAQEEALCHHPALFLSMKTYVATPSERERNCFVVDASGRTLGRLATQLADTLRGKRKPEYTPHCDVGDFVIVVNAEKISVTGDKRDKKRYYRHSGYPGGLRSRTLGDMLERRPEEVIRLAVKGMLPRNRLARQQLRKLKVYAGPDHPHTAQKPQPLEVRT